MTTSNCNGRLSGFGLKEKTEREQEEIESLLLNKLH